MALRNIRIDDYERVIEFWEKTPGIGVSSADSKEGMERFLIRNKDLSFLWEEEEMLIGTVLSGHDGRRGFIYHLAVDEAFRNREIAKKLLQSSLEMLRKQGIEKCHLFVFDKNELGKDFWKHMDWIQREDIVVFSKDILIHKD
ncbi:MAG: GNAT family N-acetyltransferase [Thermotaleaceae bacterium]